MPKLKHKQSSNNDLRETIRAVRREELRKMFSESSPRVDSITEIACDEVRQSLEIPEPPPPHPVAMSYAAAVRRNAPPPQFRRQTPPPAPKP